MKKIISILGSLNMDIVLSVEHLPTCGETILSRNIKRVTGGKGANQAVAAARLGNTVYMIGKLGNDEFGGIIREMLNKDNINNEFVLVDDEKPTGTAYIPVDDLGNNLIIVDSGANMSITKQEIENANNIIEASGIIISQFETPIDITIQAFKIAKSKGTLTILNPAPAREIPKELFNYTDIVVPNETEAEILSGIKIDNLEAAEKAAKLILDMGCKYVVITLGEKGVLLATKAMTKHIEAYRVNAVDTTAAGDAFIGAFATKLLSYGDIDLDAVTNAIKFGNLVSSIVVQRHGAQPSLPYLQEVALYSKEMKL